MSSEFIVEWTDEQQRNLEHFLALSPEEQQAEINAIMAENLASYPFTLSPDPGFQDGEKVIFQGYDGEVLEGFIRRNIQNEG